MEITPVIWFDLDGVLADFDSDYIRRTGKTWDHELKWSNDEKWELLKDHPDFFENLPWMPGAQFMIEYVMTTQSPFLCGILSAASPHIEQSAEQKRIWCKREMPWMRPENVKIVSDAIEKRQYANVASILVDNRQMNIDQWREAGGIGILFENTLQAMKELNLHIRGPVRLFNRTMQLIQNEIEGTK
jgi:5'(3')-deoxyribonucleotidase